MLKGECGSLALTSLYIFFMCSCRKQVFAIICVNKGFIYHVLSPYVTILFWALFQKIFIKNRQYSSIFSLQ